MHLKEMSYLRRGPPRTKKTFTRSWSNTWDFGPAPEVVAGAVEASGDVLDSGMARLVLLDVERLGDLVDNSRHDAEVAEGALFLVTRGYEGGCRAGGAVQRRGR